MLGNPGPLNQELADKQNMSQYTICRHLEKMGKVSKLGVWVPHALSEKNKADRLSIATSLLSRQRNDPFLDEFIAGDEKWITYDNVVCKGCGLIRINLHSWIQKLNLMAEK